jgi:hypothetical protein
MSSLNFRLIVTVIVLLLTGVRCSNHFDSDSEETPPCNPATNCVLFPRVEASRCDANPHGEHSEGRSRRYVYQVKNEHPSRHVLVAFKLVVNHVNQPGLEPDTLRRLRRVEPNSAIDLECEYKLLGRDQWDHRSYILDYACFEDASDCETDPIPFGDSATKCDSECTGDLCLHRRRPSGDPIEQQAMTQAAAVASRFLYDSPPISINLTRLLAVDAVCPEHGPATITSNSLTSYGSSCRIYLPVEKHATVSAVHVTLGATIEGAVTGNSTGKTIRLQPNAVLLQWFDTSGNSIGNEPASRIAVTASQLRIVGERRSCIWVDLPIG